MSSFQMLVKEWNELFTGRDNVCFTTFSDCVEITIHMRCALFKFTLHLPQILNYEISSSRSHRYGRACDVKSLGGA